MEINGKTWTLDWADDTAAMRVIHAGLLPIVRDIYSQPSEDAAFSKLMRPVPGAPGAGEDASTTVTFDVDEAHAAICAADRVEHSLANEQVHTDYTAFFRKMPVIRKAFGMPADPSYLYR